MKFVLLFCLCSLQVLAERLEIVLLPLELGGGVDLAGADLGYGHLHIVHPFHHLGVPDHKESFAIFSKHCSGNLVS